MKNGSSTEQCKGHIKMTNNKKNEKNVIMRFILVLTVISMTYSNEIKVILQRKVENGETIFIKEKYGSYKQYKKVNLVIEKDGIFYISVNGNLVGTFPVCNHSVEIIK